MRRLSTRLSTCGSIGHGGATPYLLCLLLGTTTACGSDSTDVPRDPGTDLADAEPYAGQIGMILDGRSLARKGHYPARVELDIVSNHGDYSEFLVFDSTSLMAQKMIELDSLSEAAIQELEDGVLVTASIFDAEGSLIATRHETKTSFQSNPTPIVIDATPLGDRLSVTKVSPKTSYFIQSLDADRNPVNSALGIESAFLTEISAVDFSERKRENRFNLIAVDDLPNAFAISYSGVLLRETPTITNFGTRPLIRPGNVRQIDNLPQGNERYDYLFQITKEDDEVYRIAKITPRQRNGETTLELQALVVAIIGGSHFLTTDQAIPTAQYEHSPRWRILPVDIDWSITSIGTSYFPPILPPAQTSLSFDNELMNCGTGLLTQTVGASETKTTQMTVGWEESVSVTTRNQFEISLTVGVEFEAKFFGTGAKYNASVTASYLHEREETAQSTRFGDRTEEIERNSFSERTVEVPAGTAIRVTDTFQLYPETRVAFVQRLRVRANRKPFDGSTLPEEDIRMSGEEIKSNFVFTGFNGVINHVGSDFIDISLRGTATFDQLVRTNSVVRQIAGSCD